MENNGQRICCGNVIILSDATGCATETGWNKEQFLSQCCAGKAGLPPDAWKQPDTEVLLFTAEVFGEKEFTEN